MKKSLKSLLTLLVVLQACCLMGQSSLPFNIKNTSEYANEELYVAIVGINFSGEHVWVDMKTGNQLPMDPSYNTVKGPEYGGNKGPGENGMYADCFTKLSEVPNQKIMLQPIQGCRMFISVKEQLYLYFFGSTGSQVGYASPSHTNTTDPSQGIVYELIELTYNEIGFWGNTSRVDSYNYAMGLELTNKSDVKINTGELLKHNEIIEEYLKSVPAEFKTCYDEHTGQIFQPTKTKEWADGTIGGVPAGPNRNYMQPYIDQVWQKYTNEDLIFDHPQIGTWKGRVTNNKFTFTCVGGNAIGFIGEVGEIPGKPNTQEAFEGKGVLDREVNNRRFDLMMQAQVCAALTRHVIDVDAIAGSVQNWGDTSTYYKKSPCNHYAKFWHKKGIRVNQLAYGFAYDDVYEQSSTMHSPTPKSLTAIFGGYGYTPTNTQSPYMGTRHHIPGTIEAEHYDEGGLNLAYYDASTENLGNSTLRGDNVDIESDGEVSNVGYIEKDEWLDYSVTVQSTGIYDLTVRIAAENEGGTFKILLDDEELVLTTATGSTQGWSRWKDVLITNINLTEGDHVITFKAIKGDFNFDKMMFSTSILTGTEGFDETFTFSVYPNPTQDFITIDARDSDGGKVTLYDMSGNKKLSTSDFTNSLNVSALSSGVYIVQYEEANEVYRTLLVIK